MYSNEDRIRAVRLYVKLGKRITATIQQLGYPIKNALKSWYRELELCCDLPEGYMRSKSKYSNEQKKAAVEHYLSHNRCMAGTSKALGYPCLNTRREWIEKLHPEVLIHVVGKAAGVRRSSEGKREAVIELCTRQESAQAVAKKLDVNRSTLYKFAKE